MTTSLIISRASLSKADLQVEAPGSYRVSTISFGAVQVEKEYARSVPWVAYDRPTHLRKANRTWSLRLLVCGSTAAQLRTRMEDVREALCDQYEFTVQHTIDGFTETYVCIAADTFGPDSQGGGIDERWHREFKQVIAATGPHMGTL